MPRVRTALGRWWVIAAYASLAAFASCAASAVPGVAAAKEDPVSMSVAARSITRPIAPGFLGLALEYSGIRRLGGTRDRPQPNPVLVQLIRNLDPVGRPVIRIGGLSTDHSWWPVPGMKEPLGHHLHPHAGVGAVAAGAGPGASTRNSCWASTWRPTARGWHSRRPTRS